MKTEGLWRYMVSDGGWLVISPNQREVATCTHEVDARSLVCLLNEFAMLSRRAP